MVRKFSSTSCRINSVSALQQVLHYTSMPKLVYPAALPTLAYNFKEGIAPVFSARQMELHYTKHHKSYVDKLNTLGKGFEGKTIEEMILAIHEDPSKKVMFNQAAQHFNHTFYWNCLVPNGTTEIPGQLKSAIVRQFGSVDKFKEAFQAAGGNNFGSGWTWLCVDPSSKELVIDNTSNAGCPLTKGLRPVFTADVWEHAYYKDFENRRPDYLKEMWKVVNWDFVGDNYSRAIVA